MAPPGKSLNSSAATTASMSNFIEIHNAAQEELAGSAEAITRELSEIYLELESGRITEGEFDAREKVLLDRLDRVQGTA